MTRWKIFTSYGSWQQLTNLPQVSPNSFCSLWRQLIRLLTKLSCRWCVIKNYSRFCFRNQVSFYLYSNTKYSSNTVALHAFSKMDNHKTVNYCILYFSATKHRFEFCQISLSCHMIWSMILTWVERIVIVFCLSFREMKWGIMNLLGPYVEDQPYYWG